MRRGENMYAISELCSEFKLSRSTLLYYDKIGLLSASERSDSNYRKYSEDDRERLCKICAFREAGVPLLEIKDLLENGEKSEKAALEKRLDELNDEIRYLRFQQKIIVEMLKEKNISDKKMIMDKDTFVSILKTSGFREEVMEQLHKEFEKNAPEAHQFFLEFLGISKENIKHIRESSK